MLRYAARLVVAVIAVAAGLGVPQAAHAATCSTSHGVTVVVDFHQLGSVHADCDAHGAGRTAADQLTDVGYQLTYVQRQPGFVCRVDGAPSDDPCVNTPPDNAYWSVWWSDGKSGTWKYSSLGVASLKVPDGGYVALSWQGQASKAEPRVAPKAHPAPSPSSTPSPSRKPSSHATSPPPPPAPTPTTQGSASATTSARAESASAKPHHAATRKPSSSAAAARPSGSTRPSAGSQAAGTPATAVAETGDDGSSGVPAWLPPALVLALLGAAGTVAVVRRKRVGGG